jgi:hypothetical protein
MEARRYHSVFFTPRRMALVALRIIVADGKVHSFESGRVAWLTSLQNRVSLQKILLAWMCVHVTASIRGRMKQDFPRRHNSTLMRMSVSTAAHASLLAPSRPSTRSRIFPRDGRNSLESTPIGTPRGKNDECSPALARDKSRCHALAASDSPLTMSLNTFPRCS